MFKLKFQLNNTLLVRSLREYYCERTKAICLPQPRLILLTFFPLANIPIMPERN